LGLSSADLEPEEKVRLAIGMTDVCVRVCADAIRDQYPTIKDKEMVEKIRARILYSRKRRSET